MEKKFSKFLCVALALNYMSRFDAIDTSIEILKSIEHPIGKYAMFIVEILSLVGSGNIFKVQEYVNMIC